MSYSFITPTLTVAFLLFFLSPTTTTAATAALFRDDVGNPVVNGGSYIIRRDFFGPDEGPISWGNTTYSKSCPLYVVQTYIPVTGDPAPDFKTRINTVTITSPVKSRFIPLGVPVDFVFNDKKTQCKKQPLKWWVKPGDEKIGSSYVVAGKKPSSIGGGFFKVVDAGNIFKSSNYVYNLTYCSVPDAPCLQVGSSNAFPSTNIFGITTNPKLNFGGLNFFVAKSS